MSPDYSSFKFRNGWLRYMSDFDPQPERPPDTEKERTSVISETIVSLLTPRRHPDPVISAQWLLFLSPTGKRSSEMIKWTFPGLLTHSHCEYRMAFIKCCSSNRYLRDCSVITDNEKYGTNLVSPNGRRGSAALNRDCGENSGVNKVTWKRVCVIRYKEIAREGGMSGEKQRGLSLDPGLLCTWHLTWGISENQHPLKCE